MSLGSAAMPEVDNDADHSSSPFPPIADYGFLSDCENNCLIAPDGAVEWLCLPRPDSPSVFGALLDRTAGLFRFGPSNTQVPHQRRYVPGTMVLETTWHTPTGWLVVQDLLVVRPVHGRRPPRRLPPGPGRLRPDRAPCCGWPTASRAGSKSWSTPYRSSSMAPLTGTWDYDGEGYGSMTVQPPAGDPALPMTSSLRLGIGRGPLLRPYQPRRGRVAPSWRCPGAASLPFARRGRRPARRHGGLLAGLAVDRHLSRSSLAQLHRAQRPHAEGPELCTDRRHHGGRHHLAAGNAGRGPQLGLPLYLDSGLLVHASFALPAWASSGRRSSTSPSSSTRWPAARRATGSLQIMYGIGGEKDLTEHTLDHLSGYRRLPPGPGGQRGVGPAPKRRVGHAARRR